MARAEAGTLIRVSVCHAGAAQLFLEEVAVAPGSTIAQAIAASGLPARLPGVDVAALRVGIFSKLKTPDTVVREGDRVEVYRALIADPKAARRKRVTSTRKTGTREGLKWLRNAGVPEAALPVPDAQSDGASDVPSGAPLHARSDAGLS